MAHDNGGKWIGLGFDQITGVPDTGETVAKVQHRLLFAYAKNSKAITHGVHESGTWDAATRDALIDLMVHVNRTEGTSFRTDGIADYAIQVRIGAQVPPILGPKYRIQGVGHDTRAYLMPPDAPSFNRATAAGASEAIRLTNLIPNEPIVGIGYSMGAKTLRDYEARLTPQMQAQYKLSINFGDPSMRAEGSLLGNDAGEGISREPHPDWVVDRYYSYSIDGDWYPRSRGLLFFLYQVIARAELTLDFASWLFLVFPMQAMQELTGLKDSDDPVAGALSGLAPMMTTGPANSVGALMNPLQLLTILPSLVGLLSDAVKFAMTSAHGMYGDPAHAFWDGMTAVDHAVKTIREKVPDGATLLLFPGSWAQWNQGFQFDVALRLQ
jgi:hypothetical protein